MKLSYSRPALVASQIAGLFREPRCLTSTANLYSLLSSPPVFARPAQQWQSHRTIVAGSTATVQKNSEANSTREVNKQSAEGISDQVRLLMRRVPYPVAIITATDPHSPVDKAFRGMTVSSFNTVTLKPEPIISFNVRRPSETLSALQSSGRFLVHLLSPSQATAALARDFSKGNHNLSLMDGKGEYEFAPHTPNHDTTDSARPLPLLRRRLAQTSESSPVDFPFVFECKLKPEQVEVNDHTIVLGSVVKTLAEHSLSVDGKDTKASTSDLCLTYADTRFWGMGHEI